MPTQDYLQYYRYLFSIKSIDIFNKQSKLNIILGHIRQFNLSVQNYVVFPCAIIARYSFLKLKFKWYEN